MKIYKSGLAVSLCILFNYVAGFSQSSNPIELGIVAWERDLDLALARSKKEHKPVLILFQEVPGCLTCQQYGDVVLSHPLIVEAIETYFIPLAVYNNRSGKDAEVLSIFKEPSWNNPVVRIIDSKRNDIVPRLAGDYSPSGLTRRMLQAMKHMDIPVPGYLGLIDKELSGWETGMEKITVGMH